MMRFMKKKVVQTAILVLCTVGLTMNAFCEPFFGMTEIEDESTPLGSGFLVKQTQADINIIPDKYNCGATGDDFAVASQGHNFGTLFLKASGEKNIFEFAYSNRQISGTVTFDNVDFSQYPVCVYNESSVNRKIKLVFNNCIFSSFSTGVLTTEMSYEFNNCTIKSFYGSNAVFSRCMFGNGFNDALTPFQNVTVTDSYFRDMASDDPASKGIHTDGTQMYGHKNAMVKNVTFTNCRFEIPAIKTSDSAASINACIMIQLEYNNADNIKIENCKLNGGGYTIYAHTKSDTIKLQNIDFNDVEVGVAHLFNDIYPHVSDGVTFENVRETDSLYVGSVWKEGGETFVSVSNDTNIKRTLLIYTDGKEYQYEIPACPDGRNLYRSFEDFPFDIKIKIPSDCKYVVCYDATDNNNKQIRFMNWDRNDVYSVYPTFSDDESVDVPNDETINAPSRIIAEGMCGKKVCYKLDENGLLRLYGEGATYDYHSLKCAPWYHYAGLIKEIEIEEGVVVLGNQLFRNLAKVKSVKIPKGITALKLNVFIGCCSLQEVRFPQSLTSIGNYSFCGTAITQCEYEGNPTQWAKIYIGAHNEKIENCKVNYVDSDEQID